MKKIIIIISVVVLLILLRVGYVSLGTKYVDGTYPVAKLKFYKHWITVYPDSDTNISDFVDMDLFYGFRENMTFDDAVSNFGEPDNIRQEEHNNYYEYNFDNARVDVGREEYSTGDGIGVSWALYSYPVSKSYYEVLIPQIADYVDPSSVRTAVTILDSDGDVRVLVYILGNRVDHLILY